MFILTVPQWEKQQQQQCWISRSVPRLCESLLVDKEGDGRLTLLILLH